MNSSQRVLSVLVERKGREEEEEEGHPWRREEMRRCPAAGCA
jgi:hypothetical protein